MTLEVDKTRRGGFLDEFRVKVGVAGDEGDVHHGTVFFVDAVAEQLGGIEIIVKQLRLGGVALLHFFKAAEALDPFQNELADVDGVAGRGVEQGTGSRLLRVVDDRRGHVARVAEQVFAHDEHGETGRADVLLRAAVDETEFGHVHRLGQEAGGHVGKQRHVAGVGDVVIGRAVNGVVEADVNVIGFGVKILAFQLGDVRERILFGAGDHAHVTVFGRFFVSLGGKLAGENVIGLFVLVHEVQRDAGELRRGAALQEQNLVIVGDVENLAEQRFRFLNDLFKHLGAVRHFHHGLAAALVVQHFRRRAVENRFGQHGRTGAEIEYSCHHITSDDDYSQNCLHYMLACRIKSRRIGLRRGVLRKDWHYTQNFADIVL